VEKHDNAVKTILGLGEEKMGEVVNQLLANEGFVSAVQKAISGSIGAKRSVDKGVSTLLGMINVPTLDDIDKIKEKMNELEETIAEIGERLEKLNGKLDSKAKAG
jgi:peptidoglycan hydrolase CwlO-like protein